MIEKGDVTARDLAAYISSDTKALRIVLEDLQDAAPPYRLHAAIVLTEHLEELSDVLMEVAEKTQRAKA